MNTFNKIEDLKVWQKSRLFCKAIYTHINSGAFKNDYALINQISRSSGSIMDNIAEGCGRMGNKEFINFLSYAHGSAVECKSQIYRAFDRQYLSNEDFQFLLESVFEIMRMILSLINYLRKTDYKGIKFKNAEADPSIK